MKIIGFMGSPRAGGNTDVLMERTLAGAREAGAEVEKIMLDKLDIAPCRHCEGCEADGECAQSDDMTALYEKILGADGFVFGTPIYWWGPTAQFKLFLDRWYALIHHHTPQLAAKRAAFLFAFGDDDPSVAEHTDGMLSCGMDYLDIPVVGRVLVSALDRDDVYKSPEKLEEAYQLGQTLAQP